MKNLEKMKRDRQKLIDEMKSITSEAEKRDDKKMTEDEGKRWDEIDTEVNELKKEIERETRMQEFAAEEARDADDPEPAHGSEPERRSTPLIEDLQAIIEKRAITGMSELVPADGGFLVNTDQVSGLIKNTYEQTKLANKCKKIKISSNSNAVTINAIAETSRQTGSRSGGLVGRWIEEAGAKEYSEIKFRKIELKLKKLATILPMTDELRQDAPALESIVTGLIQDDFSWLLDDAVYRGPGGGSPVGVLGHASAVNVAIQPGQPNATIVYENIVDMFSRMISSSMSKAEWYINQDCLPQLYTMALAVGLGGVPVYMPAGMASASPYGTLMGKPVNVIEQASTLGTVGDIAFLDLSQYYLAEKGGLDQASSIHVRFLNDETLLRFVIRVDGQPKWNSSITPATGSANTLSPFVFLAGRP